MFVTISLIFHARRHEKMLQGHRAFCQLASLLRPVHRPYCIGRKPNNQLRIVSWHGQVWFRQVGRGQGFPNLSKQHVLESHHQKFIRIWNPAAKRHQHCSNFNERQLLEHYTANNGSTGLQQVKNRNTYIEWIMAGYSVLLTSASCIFYGSREAMSAFCSLFVM